LLTRKIVKEVDMISRLEQAIECGVLPERIDIYGEDIYLGIDIVDKKYWIGYEGNEHQNVGPPNDNFIDYFETLDEAVDALIPLLWAELKNLDGDDWKSYEDYCLDLVYEIMVRPVSKTLEIKELNVSLQADSCEGWLEKYEQQLKALRIQKIKELCANGDRVPLPMPFDNVEY
jgi:hypothetical protein